MLHLYHKLNLKNLNDALNDSNWIVAMQDELNQFTGNYVWSLVPRSDDKNIIGTKWLFINKIDEDGNIVTNKSRLVAKDYNQDKGNDFYETYAFVAMLEVVRLLLAYTCMCNFKLFQMDVKSAFLKKSMYHNHLVLKINFTLTMFLN